MSLKTILATAVALTLSAGAASAAVLDFIGAANGNERGLANNSQLTFDGVTVGLNAGSFFPYLDSKNAGLGVCQNVTDFSNGGESNRCASGAGDDNVTNGEAITLSFSSAFTLSDLLFTGEGHSYSAGVQPLTTAETLLFSINGEGLARYTFAELSTMTFDNVMSFTLAFDAAPFDVSDDRNLARMDQQFYLAAATVVPVPLPAAGLMLLAGLGALGAARRRRG